MRLLFKFFFFFRRLEKFPKVLEKFPKVLKKFPKALKKFPKVFVGSFPFLRKLLVQKVLI